LEVSRTAQWQRREARPDQGATRRTKASSLQLLDCLHAAPHLLMPRCVLLANAERVREFLREYDTGSDESYLRMLQQIANRARRDVSVRMGDLADFDAELAFACRSNALRYSTIFAHAADKELPEPTALVSPPDVFDVLTRARQDADANAGAHHDPSNGNNHQQQNRFPEKLLRRFSVYFQPHAKDDVSRLRTVRSADIGRLVTLRGIVIKAGDVKPMAEVCCYTCDTCGKEVYQEVAGDTFMPLSDCPTDVCRNATGRAGQLSFQTRASKFVEHQELRLQELSEEVPVGTIPRSLCVEAKGELVKRVSPGDTVDLTGVYLHRPHKAAQRQGGTGGLIGDFYMQAHSIKRHKSQREGDGLTEEQSRELQRVENGGSTYDGLANSIAPEIHGNEDVKKALLLLLAGGSGRVLPDGMKLRGDVHVCLVGDPGVAKSQLLKQMARISPRGLYTTGRGSSGAGLTAAVSRDNVTGETVLEGGALVVADRGACCIDEFDKMDDVDRTAIHEAMEQQTVSVAKAGITTTLNARTAVLAAANPVAGTYDSKRSPSENINLQPALLSRFDLLWVLRDLPDRDKDHALAQHVIGVHTAAQMGSIPAMSVSGGSSGLQQPSASQPVPPEVLRAYLASAREVQPALPERLMGYVADCYVQLRQEMQEEEEEAADPMSAKRGSGGDGSYVTPRTLLSIFRLGEALARLRKDTEVQQEDIDEALRLMKVSKASLAPDESSSRRKADPTTAIFNTIKDAALSSESGNRVQYARVRELITLEGYTEAQLQYAIGQYEQLAVLSRTGDSIMLL